MTRPSVVARHSRPRPGDPAANHFTAPLPRGLRDVADALNWDNFYATYACSGAIRLGSWSSVPGRGGLTDYRATIAVGDRICTSSTTASGPIGALTAMLHEHGIPVEMLNFHQLPAGGQTATFIRGTDGAHTEWALGWAECPNQSALRAVIACANRLLV